MKTVVFVMGILMGSLVVFQPVWSQESPTKKLRRESNRVINRNIDKLFNREEEEEKQPDQQQQTEQQAAQEQEPAANQDAQGASEAGEPKPALTWAKYDFVPGDKVIFEDNLEGEENGEFPSRWDLVRGNVEVAEYGGEKVIMFRDGEPSIVPYFKEAKEDYLPDVFTVEFDLYCDPNDFVLYLFDRKNQNSGSPTGYTDLAIDNNSMDFATSSSDYPGAKGLPERRWMHVSVAYTNGKLKAYMDDTRLINIPRIDFDPKGITLYTYHARNERQYYVKNVRIAEGGVKYYDRVMQDGKIVGFCHYKHQGENAAKTTLLTVLPEFRGLGLGEKLQLARMREAREKGYKILLTFCETPATVDWYVKHFGYKILETEPVYHRLHFFQLKNRTIWAVHYGSKEQKFLQVLVCNLEDFFK